MLPEEVKFLMQMYDSLNVANALEDKSPYERKMEYKKKIIKLLQDEQISKEAYEIACKIYGLNTDYSTISTLNSKINSTNSSTTRSVSIGDPCSSSFFYSGRSRGGC